MKSPPKSPAKLNLPSNVQGDPEAKREWIRITAALTGRLDDRDISLLADYCMTHSEIIDLYIAVREEGRTCESEKGGRYINPTQNLLISRQSHLAALRRDLYFTPRSRIEKQPKSLSKGKSIRDSIDHDEDDHS